MRLPGCGHWSAAARERKTNARADKQYTGTAVEPASAPRTLHNAADLAGDEGIEAVEYQCDAEKRCRQHSDLRFDRKRRARELRQKGAENRMVLGLVMPTTNPRPKLPEPVTARIAGGSPLASAARRRCTPRNTR